MSNVFRHLVLLPTLTAGLFLAACHSSDVEPSKTATVNKNTETYSRDNTSIFGPGGLTGLFSGNKAGNGDNSATTGIGVNTYLWRASLDTISFMPITSADPFGGVIITDWYAPPETPNERFKVNIFIIDRTLRADALKATIFRQNRNADGSWSDAPVDDQTALNLEDQILTRAREMKVESAEVAKQQQ